MRVKRSSVAACSSWAVVTWRSSSLAACCWRASASLWGREWGWGAGSRERGESGEVVAEAGAGGGGRRGEEEA